MSEWHVVVVMLTVALVFFVQSRLAELVHPLRLALAEEGEELLRDGRLPAFYRDLVKFELDNAFNPWISVVLSGMLPVFVIGRALNVKLCRRERPQLIDIELRRKFERVDAMFTRSMICANIVGGLIFLVEIATVILLLAILRRPWTSLETAKVDAIEADMHAPWLGRHARQS